MDILINEDKRKGLIATVVFHLILLIIFLFSGLKIPVPLPEEQGLPVQLDLGNTDFGAGEFQPKSTATPIDNADPQPETQESTPTESPEEVATQETASDLTIPEKTEAKKPVEKKPELDERLKKAISGNPFQSKENNESKGEGNTDQAGDHGKKDGSENGNSLYGDKSGGGISHSLGGRGFKGAPAIQGNWQESGKIVVNIIVDRDGNVVRVTPGGRGTTINNAELVRQVVESARKAKFTPKADAPAEQKGTMEFTFVLE